jgi:hypothetical protein
MIEFGLRRAISSVDRFVDVQLSRLALLRAPNKFRQLLEKCGFIRRSNFLKYRGTCEMLNLFI